MSDIPIRGASAPVPPDLTAETFDRAHGTTAKNALLWRLAREAYGDEYPEEIQAWGMTTWWTLGQFVSGLRVGPGQRLVDLACGRAGVGLWLARATGAQLTGVDWSPVAVSEAAARAPQFVPAGRASFVVGDLAATALESDSADGAVCADAVFFAADRVAVFAEMARILRPGGRFIFTADESDDTDRQTAVPDWGPIVRAGGLDVVSRQEIPHWHEDLKRMYDGWLANRDELAASLDKESLDDLIGEASAVGPTLSRRTGVLYTTQLS
ncbi:MAG TPA: class I SAM-dependent methyltransferase [Acidothermaceae bacterium]